MGLQVRKGIRYLKTPFCQECGKPWFVAADGVRTVYHKLTCSKGPGFATGKETEGMHNENTFPQWCENQGIDFANAGENCGKPGCLLSRPLHWDKAQMVWPHDWIETVIPIPMLIHCPMCKAKHVDVGEFATEVHHTHACQGCGHVWRPAIVATVGVEFLPGFKNELAEKCTCPMPGHGMGAACREERGWQKERRRWKGTCCCACHNAREAQ
jgi:rubredoxin